MQTYDRIIKNNLIIGGVGKVGLFIFVLAIGAMAVFFWQNQQPITLIFLGGSWSAQLPLAAWVLLFAAAGVLSSFVLRGLNAWDRKPPAARDSSAPPRRRQPPPPPPTAEPVSTVRPSPPSAAASDWQAPPPPEPETWDDWTEEASSPPAKQPPPEPATRESELRNFERDQQPRSVSREGSIYSYRYREPGDRPQERTKIGGVVDANYRVIVPPYQSPSQPPLDGEDEEDWLE